MWKTIQNHPNYQVNEKGEVRNIKKGQLIKPQPTTTGYLRVTLSTNGVTKKVRVHRLVAEYFLPNTENKPQVNHKDANKNNNHVSNLEWVTASENMIHAQELGLAPKPIRVVQYTLEGEYITEHESLTLAAKSVSGNTDSIHSCCKGRYKQHKNYIWKFKD